MNENTIVVVYIGGFLVPKGRIPYGKNSHVNKNMKFILVYPSGVSSIHDRVMQIFYELKGGQIYYGKEHSQFHGHDEKGHIINDPKYPQWSERYPIHIVGHSYGGPTARALHYYLTKGTMFHGYTTNSNWIISVSTINSPLNGSLRVYSYGANLISPTIVRWGSVGCLVGWLAHLFEFLDTSLLMKLYDFQLGYWNLSRQQHGSFTKFLLSLLGCCIHTTTDNSAFDMTVHSQLQWSKYLKTYPNTYYLSVVGDTYAHAPWGTYLAYVIPRLLLRALPTSVCGIQTAGWSEQGNDGLLSLFTQLRPCLHHYIHLAYKYIVTSSSSSSADSRYAPDGKDTSYTNLDHIMLHDELHTDYEDNFEVIKGDVDTTTTTITSATSTTITNTNNNNNASNSSANSSANNNNNKDNTEDKITLSSIGPGKWYIKQLPIHHLDDPTPDRDIAWSTLFDMITLFHTHYYTHYMRNSITYTPYVPYEQIYNNLGDSPSMDDHIPRQIFAYTSKEETNNPMKIQKKTRTKTPSKTRRSTSSTRNRLQSASVDMTTTINKVNSIDTQASPGYLPDIDTPRMKESKSSSRANSTRRRKSMNRLSSSPPPTPSTPSPRSKSRRQTRNTTTTTTATLNDPSNDISKINATNTTTTNTDRITRSTSRSRRVQHAEGTTTTTYYDNPLRQSNTNKSSSYNYNDTYHLYDGSTGNTTTDMTPIKQENHIKFTNNNASYAYNYQLQVPSSSPPEYKSDSSPRDLMYTPTYTLPTTTITNTTTTSNNHNNDVKMTPTHITTTITNTNQNTLSDAISDYRNRYVHFINNMNLFQYISMTTNYTELAYSLSAESPDLQIPPVCKGIHPRHTYSYLYQSIYVIIYNTLTLYLLAYFYYQTKLLLAHLKLSFIFYETMVGLVLISIPCIVLSMIIASMKVSNFTIFKVLYNDGLEVLFSMLRLYTTIYLHLIHDPYKVISTKTKEKSVFSMLQTITLWVIPSYDHRVRTSTQARTQVSALHMVDHILIILLLTESFLMITFSYLGIYGYEHRVPPMYLSLLALLLCVTIYLIPNIPFSNDVCMANCTTVLHSDHNRYIHDNDQYYMKNIGNSLYQALSYIDILILCNAIFQSLSSYIIYKNVKLTYEKWCSWNYEYILYWFGIGSFTLLTISLYLYYIIQISITTIHLSMTSSRISKYNKNMTYIWILWVLSIISVMSIIVLSKIRQISESIQCYWVIHHYKAQIDNKNKIK